MVMDTNVALITGGSRGIGAAAAKLLAAEGWAVAINYRVDKAAAEATAKAVEAAGGAAMIKSLYGPFSEARICPTGGIGLHNVMEYLSLPNVLCVGGSWICPAQLVRDQRWDEIEQLAREASQLGQ